jgi:RNA polymerase sigma-70 factor, ECF subfamily
LRTDDPGKELDDARLIELFKGDPRAAFKEIVKTYQDRIFNLCVYMLHSRDDAQDAAQDAFVKAYRSFGSFTPKASLYTWLYRIAVNTCIDYKRKSREVLADDETVILQVASQEPSPERLCESKEITGVIQKALESLNADFRAVIVLKEMEELSYEEIAQVLQISIGTVKSRLSRAREELRGLVRGKL